jgi:hypothetical protein
MPWRLPLLLCVLAPAAGATDFYVRTDGGDTVQCDGRTDAPRIAGDPRCAWSHPFFALPRGGPPRIAGGDTLHVGPGEYRIGLGAPGATGCSEAFPWDCTLAPVPSGTASQPTRILGTDARGRCTARPQWWGAERAAQVLDLSGSEHVEVACLELTDHAGCVENHCHGGACAGEVARCERDRFPYGDWAGTGLKAHGASDITLRDVDIHGLALRGIHAGRLRDWHLQRVRLAGNGWSGWDGDIGADGGNTGSLRFDDVEIAWNGCAERYPSREIFGCWGQSSGGYGDGLGTGATGGAWRFHRANVHDNASDGLDLLYLLPSGSVEVSDSRFGGNGGNQFKASHRASFLRNVVEADCSAPGQRGVARADLCRAGGDAIVVKPEAGTVRIEGNRVAGEGDCLVVIEGGAARSSAAVLDNRFEGRPLWADPARQACGVYAHGGAADPRVRDNEFIRVRGLLCPDDNRCVR